MNLNLDFNLADLNNLDFREMGNWPTPAKVMLCAVAFLFIVGGAYWYSIKDQLVELDSVRQQEVKLKQEFRTKAGKAANLGAYREQLKEMQASFGTLLRQLPSKTEVDSLLRDISQTAQSDGLQQDLFQPLGEVKKGFYAEKPIKMQVRGNFHEIAHFVSDVAALPRIVTLHDISIKPVGKDDGTLVMHVTAKIYRYLDAKEQAASKGRKGRR